MSEYQYYEFTAIDRPLTKDQQSELRARSSRARISSSQFINEYHWGSLKGNPVEWMEKYFDASLYTSNFGSRAIHVRLPLSLLDIKSVRAYEISGVLEVRTTSEHIILSFYSNEEPGYYDDEEDNIGSTLSSILPVRDELARGDLRLLYLGWLLAVGCGEVSDETMEPPIPLGLAELSGGQQSLADFLHIDPNLIAAAARASGPARPDKPSTDDAKAWLESLTATERDAWLLDFIMGDVRTLLAYQNEFQASVKPTNSTTARRSAGQLLAETEVITLRRNEAVAKKAAADKLERETKEAADRLIYLKSLGGQKSNLWKSVIALTETSISSNYATAVKQITDLRDLAYLENEMESFDSNLAGLRELRSRRSGLIARLDKELLV